MAINTFSVAAFAFTLAVVPASAATLSNSQTSTASIYSHDAYSRFLPGGYAQGVYIPDDGSNMQSKSNSASPTNTDALLPSPTATPSFRQLFNNAIQNDSSSNSQGNSTSDPQNSNASGSGTSVIVKDSSTGDLATRVGTVPLPPALPMFGAAVLVLGVIGFGRRRRAAARSL